MSLENAISTKLSMAWRMFKSKTSFLTFGLAHKWGLTQMSREHNKIQDGVVEVCTELIKRRVKSQKRNVTNLMDMVIE